MMMPICACFAIFAIEAVFNADSVMTGVFGAVPGMLLLMVSKMTKGDLGSGDAYLIMAAGLLIGVGDVVKMIMVAAIMAFVFALGLCLIKRTRIASIPFVPFLLCGYIGVLGF